MDKENNDYDKSILEKPQSNRKKKTYNTIVTNNMNKRFFNVK